jgi:hypothetical protein
MVVSISLRVPNALEVNVASFIVALLPVTRVISATFENTPNVLARLNTYGKSKFCILYPVIISKSDSTKKAAWKEQKSVSV